MKIIVCIKQVLDTSATIQIENGQVVSPGSSRIINPYDEYAIEEAVRIKEKKPDTEITHRDAWLKIVSVHFRDGYKWRFSDGGERPFTAEMEDAEFQTKVQEGLVALNANDAIRCRLREEQSLSASSLLKIIYVEEVLEHRPGARQMNLL